MNLIITGSKCILHTAAGSDEGEDEVDGVLEEMIAIDRPSREEVEREAELGSSDGERGTVDAQCVPSPRSSRKEEVISMLTDVIWPDVVSAMRPLVEQVVAVSRESGIQYSLGDSAGAGAGAGGMEQEVGTDGGSSCL